jgi:hypothetical protein
MIGKQDLRAKTRSGVEADPEAKRRRPAAPVAIATGASSNKERLVAHVARETALSRSRAAAALDAVLDGIGKCLNEDNDVLQNASSADSGDDIRLTSLAGFSERERPFVEGGGVAPARASDIAASAFAPDARARAMLRGVEIAQEDLRHAGGAFELGEVRSLLRGISRQRIDRRVREGSLLAVPGPSNRRRYPTAQFNPDGTVVEGLKQVCEALPTKNPWSMLNFLVAPEARLGGRKPIDLLRAGDVESVVEAARRWGRQGA